MNQVPASRDVEEVVSLVMSTIMGEGSLPSWSGSAVGAPLVGCVTISGPFRGAVTVTASRAAARWLVGRMLSIDERTLGDDMLIDGFAEVTNMIGGNLKGLVSQANGGTCQLSIPLVGESLDLPRAELVMAVHLDAANQIVVRMYATAAPTLPSHSLPS